VRRALIAIAVFASGCATTGSDPRDPLEGLNRGVYAFNQTVDDVVLSPVARLYRATLPDGLQDAVRNAFNNIDDIAIGANNLLQGKVIEALGDGLRFSINSTLGVFGAIDWASDMGLEKHNEDFGQTLARWGVGDGPYLVLPLIGPATTRDAAGLPVDWYYDPVIEHRPIAQRNVLWGTRIVARRAELLDLSQAVDEGALDRYVFVRESWLQRRRNLVYDGRPPRERPPVD
jgi:phospholipid-binding lipoprotein MlaA